MGYYGMVNRETGRVEMVMFKGDGTTPEPREGYDFIEGDASIYDEIAVSDLFHIDGRFVAQPRTVSSDRAWAMLRQRRNAILLSTDWTQLPDVAKDIRQAYLTYRQALRDLPQNTEDPLNPVWPELL